MGRTPIGGGYTNGRHRLVRAVAAARAGKLLYISDNDGVHRAQGKSPEHGEMAAANLEALAVAAARTSSGIVSARNIDWLRREDNFGAIPELQLVGSMGRTILMDRGRIETHPDAIAARPLVEIAIPIAYQRLIEAGLEIPTMTHWDPDWDGFGMALYTRGIRDLVNDLTEQLNQPPDANVDRSKLEVELGEAKALQERVATETERVFREVAAAIGTTRLALEYGDGMIGLMSAHADGSPFTKADAVRALFDRAVRNRNAPTVVLYIGDEGTETGRDAPGWRMVRELEQRGLIEVGLTVGVDSTHHENLSERDRDELDVVLGGVPDVAGFTLGVTGDGFGRGFSDTCIGVREN